MKTNKTQAATTTTKAPTHIAYHVSNRGEGKKAIWTRIGSAWAHADGEGFNIQLVANPVDGKLTLRTRTEKEEE